MIQRIRDGKRSGWYCRPCANDRAKAHRVNSPDRWLDAKLWTFYRIRLSDYRSMVEAQGGLCAACGRVPEGTGGIDGTGLVIDHDHTCCPSTRRRGGGGSVCGKCIRGLLCTQCNVALGMANDDVARLRRLISYLENHQLTSSPASLATLRSES